MTISNQNFKLYRGDSHTVFVALTQADGSAFDINAVTMVRWQMTRDPDDDKEAVVTKESGGNGITAAEGGIDITLDATDTNQAIGLYYHILRVWDDDDVDTAMDGYVVVKAGAKMGGSTTVLTGGVGP